jgi:hypothetical protein
MHVYLQDEEADKLLLAAGRLKISPTKLLHLLIQRLESIDIEEVVKFEFKPVADAPPVKKKDTIRRKNWVNEF